MLNRKIFLLMILIVTVSLAACGGSTNQAALTGVIAHTHRMTIPPDYTIIIRIEDTTKADSPGKKIAEEVIKGQGVELPIPFAIIYDPGKIDPDHNYNVHVDINDNNGALLYANDVSVPVITFGNPTRNIKVTVVLPNE